ncbi:MAG: 3-deoxy-manno-octulosonate cytidylyltransferase [Lentimicrobiaceae bacterium]|nr:3-deoxy-manno-octulosonate cytidylyltransferase [Lentimicrobiaceae bacterium]
MACSDVSSGCIGIIPARYASTRFPGKALVLIQGVSMIERVYARAVACKALQKVVVATDDQRILTHVERFGGHAILTSAHHESGTARLGETINILAERGETYRTAINIQGDEPFIEPAQIEAVATLLKDPKVGIATLIKKITSSGDVHNPNVVKAVTDSVGRALWFSRSPIPFQRGFQPETWANSGNFYKHIGIYGYQTGVLQQLVSLPPAPPELNESLEQLRWLYHGFQIYTKITEYETIGIDTPEDLLKLTNNA